MHSGLLWPRAGVGLVLNRNALGSFHLAQWLCPSLFDPLCQLHESSGDCDARFKCTAMPSHGLVVHLGLPAHPPAFGHTDKATHTRGALLARQSGTFGFQWQECRLAFICKFQGPVPPMLLERLLGAHPHSHNLVGWVEFGEVRSGGAERVRRGGVRWGEVGWEGCVEGWSGV